MKNKMYGKAYVLGDNIDTDQIIPAEYLVFSLTDKEESKKYGHFALSSVPLAQAGLPNGNIPFIKGEAWQSEFSIIIAGANFGCGSSREHAPFALQKAGVQLVIAESYARIFYRNAVDGGFLVPMEGKEKLNDKIETGDEIEVDFEQRQLYNKTRNSYFPLKPIGDVLPIVEAGGIFAYARKMDMISR